MIAAWLVHLYTATGLVFAFLAVTNTIEDDYRAAFFWLAAQVFVDATDGALARRAQVTRHLPWFDGAKLDDIVDYLSYVFVPALMVWRGLLVPAEWTVPVASAMLLSSAYGFNRSDAKTADHFYTGFPSYWNIVVLYLFIAAWAPGVNAAILLGLAVLVLVPIRYVYPSRTLFWRVPTLGLGLLWGVAMLLMLWEYPAVSPALFAVSMIFPAYYIALSLMLHARRRTRTG